MRGKKATQYDGIYRIYVFLISIQNIAYIAYSDSFLIKKWNFVRMCYFFFSKGCQHTSHRMDTAEKWEISAMFNSLPLLCLNRNQNHFWKKILALKLPLVVGRLQFHIEHFGSARMRQPWNTMKLNWVSSSFCRVRELSCPCQFNFPFNFSSRPTSVVRRPSVDESHKARSQKKRRKTSTNPRWNGQKILNHSSKSPPQWQHSSSSDISHKRTQERWKRTRTGED